MVKTHCTQICFILISIGLILMMPIVNGCNSQSKIAEESNDYTKADKKPYTTKSWKPYFEPSIYNGIWEGELSGTWTSPPNPAQSDYQVTCEYKATVKFIAMGEMSVSHLGTEEKLTDTEYKGELDISFKVIDLLGDKYESAWITPSELKNTTIIGSIINMPQEHLDWISETSPDTYCRRPRQAYLKNDIAVELVLKLKDNWANKLGVDNITHGMYFHTWFAASPGILSEFTFSTTSSDVLQLSHLEIESIDHDSVIQESGTLKRRDSLPYPLTAGEFISAFPEFSCKWTPVNVQVEEGYSITEPMNYSHKVTGEEVVDSIACWKVQLLCPRVNGGPIEEVTLWFDQEKSNCIQVSIDGEIIKGSETNTQVVTRFAYVLNTIYHQWQQYCEDLYIRSFWENPDIKQIGTDELIYGSSMISVEKFRVPFNKEGGYKEIWTGIVNGIKMVLLEHDYYSSNKSYMYEILSIGTIPKLK